jgi:hypothetical protein
MPLVTSAVFKTWHVKRAHPLAKQTDKKLGALMKTLLIPSTVFTLAVFSSLSAVAGPSRAQRAPAQQHEEPSAFGSDHDGWTAGAPNPGKPLPTDTNRDGGSNNGSLLGGAAALPLKLDHGITLADVQKAYEVCLITGRENPRVSSQLQRLFRQINKDGSVTKQPAYFLLTPGHSTFTLTDAYDKTGEGNITPHISFAYVSPNPSVEVSATERKVLLVAGADYGGQMSLSWGSAPNTPDAQRVWQALTMASPFPKVKYSGLVGDRFGNVDHSKFLLKEVAFDITAQTPDFIPFVNNSTHMPSTLSFNVRQYMECMKGELKRVDQDAKPAAPKATAVKKDPAR